MAAGAEDSLLEPDISAVLGVAVAGPALPACCLACVVLLAIVVAFVALPLCGPLFTGVATGWLAESFCLAPLDLTDDAAAGALVVCVTGDVVEVVEPLLRGVLRANAADGVLGAGVVGVGKLLGVLTGFLAVVLAIFAAGTDLRFGTGDPVGGVLVPAPAPATMLRACLAPPLLTPAFFFSNAFQRLASGSS